ncbi:MAG: hypothetical protein GY842_01205, partial [bacterium]|nr:hypothetical protein [bacterium]
TSGGEVELDAAATISSLQVTATSGTVTLRNGADLGGTVTVSGAGGRLRIAETGALNDLDLAADATVDLEASLTVDALDLTSDATLELAAGETLTVTRGLNIADHTLTLSGAGMISHVDATSGAIIADGDSTIGELRAQPGVGETFTFGGIGAASIDRLDSSLVDAGNILRKVGSGQLTLPGGLSGVFDNAIGVVVDVDEGTLAVGAVAAEDNIVLDDEVDRLTVATGATLATYGDLALAIEVAGQSDVAVSLTTSSAGSGVLTLSDGDGSELLTVDVTGLGPAGGVSVGFGADGKPAVVLTPAESVAAASLQIDGVGVGGKVAAVVDEMTDQLLTLTTANGERVRLALESLPVPAKVAVSVDDADVTVLVVDGTSDEVSTTLAATNVDDDIELAIAYNPPPVAYMGGRIVTGFWGFEQEEALGGSVTISTDGSEPDAGLAVALSYSDHDASQVDENQLRLQRLRTNTGVYEPAGTHDVGVSQPTDVLGEYGVDPDLNSAWAKVAEGGTFAVGMPDDDLADLTIQSDPAPAPRGGACGAVGMLTWSLTLTGLIALRQRTIQLLHHPERF